jgi:hypothetical protein
MSLAFRPKIFGTLHVLHSKFPGVTGFGLEIRHIQTLEGFMKCFILTQKTDEVTKDRRTSSLFVFFAKC